MAVPPPGPGENVFSTVPRVDPVWPPRLVQSPGWFGGLEAYGGLLALGGADTRGAYAFAGGQLRVRYDYYQLGAWFDVSDRGKAKTDGFRSFGGFIGAWLPYRGWVDFELSAGVGARTWTSDDVRYGESGYEVTSPTLDLRVGVSDRTSSFSAFAARIGGQIVFAADLGSSEQPWELTRDSNGEPVTETGVTTVGGFTLGLALVIGFDYGKAITPSPAASESPR
jgi:hypothetical protein